MNLNDNKYLQWLKEKYNPIEQLHDIYVKDADGNVKVEKRMAKKFTTTPNDYEEYCKIHNIPLEQVIPAHIKYGL